MIPPPPPLEKGTNGPLLIQSVTISKPLATSIFIETPGLSTGSLFLAGGRLCYDSKIPKISNYKRSSSFSAVKSINLYILQNQGAYFYKEKPQGFFHSVVFTIIDRFISLKTLETKLLKRSDQGQAWCYVVNTKQWMKKFKKNCFGATFNSIKLQTLPVAIC